MDVKNIKELLIAAKCDRTANVQVQDPGNATTYIGNGEIVITNPQGTVLSNTTAVKAVDRICIHQRALKGDGIHRSVEIPGSAIVGFYCENYSAASEQVTYMGYNGTTGTLSISPLAVDNLYWVKLIPKYKPNARTPLTFAWRSSSTVVPVNADVVAGIAANINVKKSYDSLLKVQATILQSEAITTTTQNLTVVRDSKLATWSAGHSSTAGDFLSIKGAVYVVDEVISTTQIKFTMPYQAASETVTAGTTVATQVGNVVDKTAGNWGLKIEGLEYTFEAGKFNYRKCKFDVQFSEQFVSKPVTTQADRGIGTWEQVAGMEWDLKAYQGQNVITHPIFPVDRVYDYNSTLADETYDLVTIVYENAETKNIDGHVIQFGSVVLAIPVDAGQGDGGTTTIEEVLNKYIVTEYGVGTAIALS